MFKIILTGCAGRMGRFVASLAEKSDDFSVVCGVDIADCQSFSFPVYKSINDVVEEGDCIIDFSHHSQTADLLTFAKRTNTPIVISTTGQNDDEKELIYKYSKDVAVFFSANMSLGINLISQLIKKAAAVLQDEFDIEIIEKHHNQKLDAPSGTALLLADSMKSVLKDEPEYVFDRHEYRKIRSKNEIGIHAVRGGTIVGEHEVIFAGHDEVVTISHTATSREVFAAGALKAAAFLQGKPAGLYNMDILLQDYFKI